MANSALQSNAISAKSGLTAFILCLFFGGFGIHRFYVGKIGTGILMLLTASGLGLWSIYDVISIACSNFTDKENRTLIIAHNKDAARKTIFVFGGFYAVILIIVIWAAISVAALLSVIADSGQKELAAIRAGDFNSAYAYTSSDFQKSVSLADFKKFVANNPPLQNNVSASFPDREMKDNTAVIHGSLTLKDGSEQPITMNFIKENNEWKILNLELN